MAVHDLIMAAAGAGGLVATYPIIQSSSQSTTASTTSHAITMPSGVVSGDLLITIIRFAGVITTLTPAAGWTATALSDSRRALIYKISNGTEGSTATHSSDVAENTNSVTFRINNWWGSLSTGFAAAVATGISATPNAPSLASGFPAGTTNLWLVAYGARSSGTQTLTGFPTEYVLSQNVSGTSGYAAMAGRQLTASTEDPGNATQTQVTQAWSAYTIAVRGTI